MAKAKTKKVGYDRTATEVGNGTWEWSTGSLTWLYQPFRAGINLMVTIANKQHPVVYCKDSREAGLFAEGVEAGMEMQRRVEAVSDASADVPLELNKEKTNVGS